MLFVSHICNKISLIYAFLEHCRVFMIVLKLNNEIYDRLYIILCLDDNIVVVGIEFYACYPDAYCVFDKDNISIYIFYSCIVNMVIKLSYQVLYDS